MALTLLWFGTAPAPCRADFQLFTPKPNDKTELMLYNSTALKSVTSFTGSVGAQSGGFQVLVTAGSAINVTLDTGAGFATIKPDTGTLTSLTFAPKNITAFSDFATNGQLDGPKGSSQETFTLTVYDQVGKAFSFGPITIKADSNGAFPFDFGVISLNGETISKVVFSAPDGIKESKQTEFSLAGAKIVPEPATMTLAFSGIACVGLVSLRALRRRKA